MITTPIQFTVNYKKEILSLKVGGENVIDKETFEKQALLNYINRGFIEVGNYTDGELVNVGGRLFLSYTSYHDANTTNVNYIFN